MVFWKVTLLLVYWMLNTVFPTARGKKRHTTQQQ